MPNLITGLKYQPNHEKVRTEQELLEVFGDLKKEYSELSRSFEISTPAGESIEDFKQFLRYSIQEGSSVLLNGNGDVGGFVLKNASLEYDLSSVKNLTKYWDNNLDDSCLGCHNLGRESFARDENEWYCASDIKPMDWSDCSKYEPKVKNSEGGVARKLQEIISEAVD